MFKSNLILIYFGAHLTLWAVADMFVMTTYFPYSIHNFIRYGLTDVEKYSSGWAVFTLIHAHSSIVSHTISIWLTVILAVWRYIAVRYYLLRVLQIKSLKSKNYFTFI